MLRFLSAAAVAPLVLLAASAAPAPAPAGKADTNLPVPAKALVVAQVQGVERVRGRLEKMLQTAAPAEAKALAGQFDEALNKALGGRDLKALTPDARVFVVVTSFDAGGGEFPAAVLVPVADYKTFREKLLTADERKSFEKGKGGVDTFDAQDSDKAVYAVDMTPKGYVAVTPSKDAAEALAGKYAALTPAQMGEAVADAFLSADLSLYVNLDQVNDEYGDKIRQGRQLIGIVLQQGALMGGGLDKRQMEVAKTVLEGVFQGIEDARGLALGVTFRPEGVAIRGEAAFAADTETSKLFAKEKPVPTPGLGDLPAGMASYTAGNLGPTMAAALATLSPELRAEDDDEKGSAAITKYNQLAAEAQAGGFVGAGEAPGVALNISTPADPDALVSAKVKALKALTAGAAFSTVVLKEKPAVTEGAQKVGGFTLHRVQLALDFEATVKSIADMNVREATVASMKRMVGEKPTFWFGTDGKRVVQVNAPDWPAAERVLTRYLDGKDKASADKAFRATRAQLPADASIISLIEVGRMVAMMSESFSDIGDSVPGLPFGKLPKLKPGKDGEAFLGVAVALKPSAARFDLFVPAETVKVVRGMVNAAGGKNKDD